MSNEFDDPQKEAKDEMTTQILPLTLSKNLNILKTLLFYKSMVQIRKPGIQRHTWPIPLHKKKTTTRPYWASKQTNNRNKLESQWNTLPNDLQQT